MVVPVPEIFRIALSCDAVDKKGQTSFAKVTYSTRNILWLPAILTFGAFDKSGIYPPKRFEIESYESLASYCSSEIANPNSLN